MKRIAEAGFFKTCPVLKKVLALFVLFCGAGLLAAQETPPETRQNAAEAPARTEVLPAAGPAKKWYENLRGISVGLEAGAHEYPLDEWYPGQSTEGYSIRSFYIKPDIAYQRNIQDFSINAGLDVTIDFGAPDPGPGAQALNAKSADRQNWYTIHMEEKLEYPFSVLFADKVNFPGVLSAFLTNNNHFYAAPQFPALPRRPAGNVADGLAELGAGYSHDFAAGRFYGRLGTSFRYANRFSGEIGLGSSFTVGFDVSRIKLGVETVSRVDYLPSAQYRETELTLTYDWMDFSAELEIVAAGAFESVSLNPELRCRFAAFTFRIGAEITNLGKAAAYAPYLGLVWSY
ncbi:MAG: hypothetical protein LBH35_10075 [Treponema sp.]|nr:hypothetical protein [Treponema sp.]